MLKEELISGVINFAIENEIADVNFDDKKGDAEATKVFLRMCLTLELSKLPIVLIYYLKDAVKQEDFENAQILRNEILTLWDVTEEKLQSKKFMQD